MKTVMTILYLTDLCVIKIMSNTHSIT